MRLNIAICDDDKSFMENLEKMLISYSLQFDIDIHVDNTKMVLHCCLHTILLSPHHIRF